MAQDHVTGEQERQAETGETGAPTTTVGGCAPSRAPGTPAATKGSPDAEGPPVGMAARRLVRRIVAPLGELVEGLLGGRDEVDARRLMLQQLRLEIEHLPTAPDGASAEARAKLEELLRRHGHYHDRASWFGLAEIEAVLVPALSGHSLSRWNWRLRQEFKRLATGDLYEAYINSKPPDPDDANAAEAERKARVLADTVYLLGEVQRLRLGRRRIEGVRAYFACITLVLTAAVGFTLWVFWFHKPDHYVKAMVLVPIVGLFGSFFSLITRLFSIPIKGDLFDGSSGTARRIAWFLTPFMSAVQGAIAAFVVYFVLMSGVGNVSETLVPQFVPKSEVPKGQRNFPAEPQSPPDAAKLYIWCFLAGFSERLVPDVLSQLSDKAKARKSSEP